MGLENSDYENPLSCSHAWYPVRYQIHGCPDKPTKSTNYTYCPKCNSVAKQVQVTRTEIIILK